MVIQREEPGVQVLTKRRVLYIGSSVPLETTEGLEAVQQPLRDRYPVGENAEIQGIDSWLFILTSGIQVQYVDDPDTVVFFPISSLTLCAAVRPVNAINGATGEVVPKFVSLNSDIASQNAKNPAIFTAITRRVKGRKVLECHGFLCASDQDALEVVRCTSMADKTKRQNGTVRNGTAPYRVINGQPPINRSRPGSYRVVNGAGPPSMVNGSMNRHFIDRPPSARQNVRLSAGEQFPTQVEDVPPEFFESPPPQGYFYRPNNVQAKNFKVQKQEPQPPLSARSSYIQPAEKVQQPSPPSPPSPPVDPVPPPPKPPTPVEVPQSSPPLSQQPQQPPAPEPKPYAQDQRPPPNTENSFPPPPRPRYFMPPRPGAPFYPPPPPYMRPPYYYPPPPPPMARPRFFSPPPYMRGPPYPYPYPYGPYAPNFRRRRPKRRESESPKSKSSRSGSRHSRQSRHSSRKSQKDNTERKRIPNADVDSESDYSFRPRTPPRDYDYMNGDAEAPKRERMSRREEYDKRRHKPRREDQDDRSPPPMMYSGFRPYYMYQPQAFGPYMPPDMSRFPRSNSVPPHLRYSSKERKNEKKKNKKKKNKGKNKQQRGGPPHYGPYGPREDASMESASMMGGYASEIPQGAHAYPPMDGYFYYPQKPPRDFRREKNQFLNEKSFSRRVQEEQRMSKGKKQDYYPTAYELNDAGAEERLNEPDFTMY